jgi:mxaJ protein
MSTRWRGGRGADTRRGGRRRGQRVLAGAALCAAAVLVAALAACGGGERDGGSRTGAGVPPRLHDGADSLATRNQIAAGRSDSSAGAPAPLPADSRVLRVCADPNNLPFSNARGEGFENRLAQLVARDLGRELRYTWWAQRRGFVRNTLGAGACDVVMGMPSGSDMALTTRPYYRSTYAFVSRAGEGAAVSSFDDPKLERLRVGVHLIGDDYANVPPAHALARRGLVRNVRGYSIYGDYREPNPPARLIDAVAAGEIDVAVAWGPLAGYFARRASVPLVVTPVADTGEEVAMAFDISMAVRREDRALRDTLDALLARRGRDVVRILDSYGVPRARGARPEGGE